MRRWGRTITAAVLLAAPVAGCIPERGQPPSLCSSAEEPNDDFASRTHHPTFGTTEIHLCHDEDVDVIQLDDALVVGGLYTNVRITCTGPFQRQVLSSTTGQVLQDWTSIPCPDDGVVVAISQLQPTDEQGGDVVQAYRPIGAVGLRGTTVTIEYSQTASPRYP